MVTKKASKTSNHTATEPVEAEEQTKAELQRRMEEAREDISQTVEEIKDTVVEQYETVKETVTDALDWREQFRKHSVTFSLGALVVGYVVGNGLAASLHDTAPKKKGRKSSGLFDEVYAVGEKLADEFSDVAQTVLLPALGKKIKDIFGLDVSDKLKGLLGTKSAASTRKRPAKKAATKKAGGTKGTAKKVSGKKTAKKSSPKK